jgi:HEAT repeat protein
MAIRFVCGNPDCRARMVMKEEAAGRRVRCPRCEQINIVPQPVTAPTGHEITRSDRAGSVSPPTWREPTVSAPGSGKPHPPRGRARKPSWLVLALVGGGAGGIALFGIGALVLVIFLVVRPHFRNSPHDGDKDKVVKNHEDGGQEKNVKDLPKDGNADKDQGGKPNKDHDGAVPPPPPPTDYAKVLAPGLRVAGKALSSMNKLKFGDQDKQFHQWDVDLKITNDTPLELVLGKDLLLYESDINGQNLEGVGYGQVGRLDVEFDETQNLFTRVPANPFLGYRLNDFVLTNPTGQIVRVRDKSVTAPKVIDVTDAPPGQLSFGKVPARGKRRLRLTVDQNQWVIDQNKAAVRVVLPEIVVGAPGATGHFRLVAHFRKPDAGSSSWSVDRFELVELKPADLAAALDAPGQDTIARICAANWLLQRDSAAGKAALVRTAKTLRQGDLLTACMQLLIEHKVPGAADHALDLLHDPNTSDLTRRLALHYLGAVRHQPAFDELVRKARDSNFVLATGAAAGLAEYGPEGAEALLQILQDNNQANRHETIADMLVKRKYKQIVPGLLAIAVQNHAALRTLAETAAPESFDFFVQRARQENAEDKWKAWAFRGLRLSGGKKATPVLLERLALDPEPGPNDLERTTCAVRELAESDDPAIVPTVVERAKAGRLRAVQVLANSTQPAAHAALLTFVASAQGDAYRIALAGVADRCPAKGFDLLKKATQAPQAVYKKIGARGLGKLKTPEAILALLPLLEDSDSTVRDVASLALRETPPGALAPKFVDTLITTQDTLVADDMAFAVRGSDWSDLGAVPRIKQALPGAVPIKQYFLIQVLRHLSDDAMGPETLPEFNTNQNGWVQQWLNWVPPAKQ